jgi:putative ATP-dependent endonuclease of OLD family
LWKGISEALLLPVIARCLVLKDDTHAWQRFRGSVLVPIDGVDFAPYVEILLRPSGCATIADRVIVVTDADPNLLGNRKADLEALATDWGTSAALSVFTNKVSLEHELFNSGNEAVLKKAFLDIHPRSADRWARDVEGTPWEDRAKAFVALLRDKQIRKGDFAQRLAAFIEAGEGFQVPGYLEQAIRKAAEK